MNKLIGQILLWLGFLSGALATVFATSTYSRMGMDLTTNLDEQVISSGIKEGSNAYQAGIRNGDLVISLNGEPVKSTSGFTKQLGSIKDEPTAKVVYQHRGEDEKTTNVGLKNAWATINWAWYLISAAICLAGVCFLRMGKRAAVGKDDKVEANLKQIKLHLINAVNNTESLDQQMKEFKPRQILNFIEESLLEDLDGFAEGRDSITNEYGLEVFASVMTQFAAGERAINRAWSASADGYVEEAATCVAHGLAMLQSAKKLLDAAQSG